MWYAIGTMSEEMKTEAKKAGVKKLSAILQTALPKEIPVPYESLVGKVVEEPILDDETQMALDEALVPFACQLRWEKWGMKKRHGNRTAILLQGPPGTGKTTIARYAAKKVSKAIISITMADIGGGDPGDTERNARRIFDYGKANGPCAVFIDECDSILWSRDKAGPDSMWMLAVVNAFLYHIENYTSLVILATNHAHFLDPALERRLSAVIDVPRPTAQTRKVLWKAKIPEGYPLKLVPNEIEKLSELELSGAEIENAIEREARTALVKGRAPKFVSLYDIARKIAAKTRRGTATNSKA